MMEVNNGWKKDAVDFVFSVYDKPDYNAPDFEETFDYVFGTMNKGERRTLKGRWKYRLKVEDIADMEEVDSKVIDDREFRALRKLLDNKELFYVGITTWREGQEAVKKKLADETEAKRKRFRRRMESGEVGLPLRVYGFSKRTYFALIRAGFTTLRSICEYIADGNDLMDISLCGQKARKEILDCMVRYAIIDDSDRDLSFMKK